MQMKNEVGLNDNSLPEGWYVEKLCSIGKVIRGVSYKREQASDVEKDGYLPILRATNIQNDSLVLTKDLVYVPSDVVKEEQMLQSGDIVIAISSGSKHLVGKAAQLLGDWEGSFGTFCAGVRLHSPVNKKYIGYYMTSPQYREFIRKKSSGININNLRTGDLEELLIPIAPTDDQERIVCRIEELFSQLDAATAALKRVQANLKRYKASVLKAACEGRLVPTEAELARKEGRSYESGAELLERILKERRRRWEEEQRARGKDPAKMKYPEPARPDTEGLPELPEGWCWATVEQIAEHRLGKMLDKAKNKGTLRPYLRNINVRWFHFDLTEIQQMRVTDEELENITVIPGDLVVCEGGEPGRCAVWDEGRDPMVIQKALHRVRPFSGVLPTYLAYCMASAAHSGKLDRFFTGSTIKHLTGESLRVFPIPLPPFHEQIRISEEVDRQLSVISEIEIEVQRETARSDFLRQSILKRAFDGHLL